MSERFEVKPGERGIVRIFAVDLTVDQIKGFDVAAALGVDRLDAAGIELFPVDDVKEIGLSGYMHEGLGIAADELDAARLDALEGYVLVVLSAAFAGQAATVTPKSPLRWIGTYTEETAPIKFEPLPSDSARGNVVTQTKPPPSDAAMSGRVAMIALLVIFAITGLMIWIA